MLCLCSLNSPYFSKIPPAKHNPLSAKRMQNRRKCNFCGYLSLLVMEAEKLLSENSSHSELEVVTEDVGTVSLTGLINDRHLCNLHRNGEFTTGKILFLRIFGILGSTCQFVNMELVNLLISIDKLRSILCSWLSGMRFVLTEYMYPIWYINFCVLNSWTQPSWASSGFQFPPSTNSSFGLDTWSWLLLQFGD